MADEEFIYLPGRWLVAGRPVAASRGRVSIAVHTAKATPISSHETRSLKEWQENFATIYGERNVTLTADEIWLHVVEEAGELAKALRKEDFHRVEDELADIFAWVCGFASRGFAPDGRGEDLEEILWYKYPGICPRCGERRNCVCITNEKKLSDKEAMRDPRVEQAREGQDRPGTLTAWQDVFAQIYGPVNKAVSKAQVGFHLLEEVGEVAEALRHDRHEDIRRELADVLAWIFALTVKFEKELASERGLLSEVVWKRYPDRCKDCGERPCSGDARPSAS